MTRTLQKIGNSRGLVLSRDMLDHLEVGDSVELTFEKGKIVLTRPQAQDAQEKQPYEEAKKATIAQYHDALDALSGAKGTMTPTDIKDDLLVILTSTENYISAYQALNLLPQRDSLIAAYPAVGQGGGAYFGAAGIVTKAALMLEKEGLVEHAFLDSRSVAFDINGTPVPAGNPATAVYRCVRK